MLERVKINGEDILVLSLEKMIEFTGPFDGGFSVRVEPAVYDHELGGYKEYIAPIGECPSIKYEIEPIS